MAHQLHRLSQIVALAVATSSLSACTGFRETTTSIRSLPDKPVERVRLTRAGVSPIAGEFRQQEHSVLGQLSITHLCTQESTQLIRKREESDTHTVRGTAMAWTVVGGLVTAVGAGLLVASDDADKRVSCGEGKAGDQCESESSAMQTAAFSLLVTGLSSAIAGGYFLAQKPSTETKELPAERVTRVQAESVSCGATRMVEGLSVGVEIPGNGTWTGVALADGSVRIEVSPGIKLPDSGTLPVVVMAVPANLAGVVSPGMRLGEVALKKQQPESKPGVHAKNARTPVSVLLAGRD